MPVKVHLALATVLRDIGADTMFGLIADGDEDDLERPVRAIGRRDRSRPLLLDPDFIPSH
ncbi:hypothetical protein [Mesorhizobium sp. IMUNJ 23232]|uniref:hypothetical protein n=1 Tax=Mesorhizobium sp. IMUNJ 23232 TaxID=3376064 RepID=UPI003791863E